MRRIIQMCALAIVVGTAGAARAQEAKPGPYKVLKTAKVGGAGGYDYVYADVDGRRLYVPRTGQAPAARISVFNLDTLKQVGEIADTNARGVAVDPNSHLCVVKAFGTDWGVI